MVSSRSDQIAEEASLEASLDRVAGGRKGTLKTKGVRSEVWRVKPRADDRQDPGSSAAPINMVLMLPPIQAAGFSNHS